MESDNFLSINLKQGLSRQESDSEAHSSVLGHVQHFPFNVVLFRFDLSDMFEKVGISERSVMHVILRRDAEESIFLRDPSRRSG